MPASSPEPELSGAPRPRCPPRPVVAAVEMGYGHLRAARALAAALGSEVVLADRPPLAGADEQRLWRASRRLYEFTSRASQLPVVGAPLRGILDALTGIPPLYPYRDLSEPTLPVRSLERLIRRGLGAGLAAHLAESGAPLVTTYFAPALSADVHGRSPVFCAVTDVDLNRAWVPLEPRKTGIRYLTPSRRAAKRLSSYGVPREQIEFTGFPLPHALLGGVELPVLKRNLAARLVRLDRKRVFRSQARHEIDQFLGPLPEDEEGRPPLVTYAVGGAGAQAEQARPLVAALAPAVREGRLRLCLVAGVRTAVAERFAVWLREAKLAEGAGVEILLEATLESYLQRFERRLAETDVLWTKPSELTFYGALGLPLVLSPPVGFHERYNRRWAVENGVGLPQRELDQAGYWIREWLSEGTLAAAAWFGFLRLPKFGLYRILEVLGAPLPL
ncbi:MAG TPA: hypothetical protein VIH93_01345 [Thermoanaerobaculia bacterium]